MAAEEQRDKEGFKIKEEESCEKEACTSTSSADEAAEAKASKRSSRECMYQHRWEWGGAAKLWDLTESTD